MTEYTRENPSLRYIELLGYYRTMHEKGAEQQGVAAAQTFDGRSMPRHAANIGVAIRQTGSKTVLDYGSGKGTQYGPLPIKTDKGQKFPDIKSFWGVGSITCYDPGYALFDRLPTGKFDGVISTDMLEHCPKEDISWIVDEIFSFAKKFVYLNVACYPAVKTLPNGENAHCTIEPPAWWQEIFDDASFRYGTIPFAAAFDVVETAANGEQQMKTFIEEGPRRPAG